MNFGEMAGRFHRKHVSKSAFDAEIEDGIGATIKSAVSKGASVGQRVAHATEEVPGAIDGPESPAARGHKGGLIGGPARAEVLSEAEKEKIARKGGYARWNEAKSQREE
jgi:hypothetical protein